MPFDPNKLVVVTGANSKFFLHAVLMAESFAHYCPDHKVMVCDYGLNAGERTFLERRGWLLPAPVPIEPERHAWYYKALLIDYVTWPEDGAVMWLDADAVISDDIVSRLLELAGDPPGRRGAYACFEPTCSFQLIFDTLKRDNREFIADVYRKRYGVAAGDPYVSSGVFLVFEREILQRWKEIVWSDTPGHVLFEQNAFNVALKETSVEMLDPTVFNVSQWGLLNCARRPGDGAMTTADGRRIAFLHMTANGADVLVGEHVAFQTDRGSLQFDQYKLRRPNNPDIRLLQEAFLSRAVRKYGNEFIELGIASLE